jgi:hypothetical protein
MKKQGIVFSIFLFLTSCDAVSTFQGNEIAATKKMLGKVEKVTAELRQHSDSTLYREARRIVDSIKLLRNKN